VSQVRFLASVFFRLLAFVRPSQTTECSAQKLVSEAGKTRTHFQIAFCIYKSTWSSLLLNSKKRRHVTRRILRLETPRSTRSASGCLTLSSLQISPMTLPHFNDPPDPTYRAKYLCVVRFLFSEFISFPSREWITHRLPNMRRSCACPFTNQRLQRGENPLHSRPSARAM